MYSIFNDAINNKVLVADYEGTIKEYTYDRGAIHIRKSEEAVRATKMQNDAEDDDSDTCDDTDPSTCTNQDAIFACQTNLNAASGKFRIDGTNACFKGTKFTFNLEVPHAADGTVSKKALMVTEEVDGTLKKIQFKSAKIDPVSKLLEIEFKTEKIFNASGSDLSTEANNSLSIQTSCEGKGTSDAKYDYSQLGETWSTPRIFRIPSASGATNIANDTYVAVMGGGMGNTFICSGSNVFIVNLESSGTVDEGNPGSLFGYEENDGPINIIDTVRTHAAQTITTTTENADGTTITTTSTIPETSIAGVTTPNGSNIANAIPAAPVVITPDLAKNIPWRGAMVYINDLEGKITKINLTNQSDVELYAQTTLFNLRANKANGRYNYHSMDAAIGKDTNNFWLFGGTGNYERIGQARPWMDNILYGVKDPDYPKFKHLYDLEIPEEASDQFVNKAHEVAEAANHVNDPAICVDTTRDRDGTLCPTNKNQAWVIHLDKRDGKAAGESINRYRKVSATPTVYKGNVYFPIYQPPEGVNRCNLGKAYICSADDECGTNNSSELSSNKIPAGEDCYFVRRGILSELVVFGDTLYANVAGPSATEETLVSILAGAGDITTYRRSWRENY
jgi:type IV pilus assembly protein PilY1